MQALEIVANRIDTKNLMCVIFGQTQPEVIPHLPLQTVWVGHLNDDVSLALLYNSATLMAVPSIQENLPQTATEAQACGIPVVAFNCTGMPDAVKHLSSGYLAQAYDVSDLAYGIIKIIDDTSFRGEASLAARCMAEANWSREAIVLKYIKVYESAIKTHAALR
jgi:glycosyltransferase involved in cell wall biosynthesis